MGTLVAKAYPTPLFAKLADHTYVECGTGGKAWGCWGGKSGGREIGRGAGSTRRADTIAGKKERAGVTCYLVNGVCHQAANRVLFPAGVLVRRARGYGLSEALFGTYGRVLFLPCRAPFHQHAGVTGDLPECAEAGMRPGMRVSEAQPAGEPTDWNYIQGVLALYARAEQIRMTTRPSLTAALTRTQAAAAAEMADFHVALFEFMVTSRLGPQGSAATLATAVRVRRDVERRRADAERAYAARRATGPQLAEQVDAMAVAFQQRMAESVSREEYERLFDAPPGEWLTLADPDIVRGQLRN
jgi:hypothetical protein